MAHKKHSTFLFQLSCCIGYLFPCLLCATFLHLYCFFVGTFELNGPHYAAQVLSSVPQCKKAVIYLTEKICVLDTLHSGKNDSAVDKSTIYIKEVVFERNTVECIQQLARMFDQMLRGT